MCKMGGGSILTIQSAIVIRQNYYEQLQITAFVLCLKILEDHFQCSLNLIRAS
jgi:hypothetical protein